MDENRPAETLEQAKERWRKIAVERNMDPSQDGETLEQAIERWAKYDVEQAERLRKDRVETVDTVLTESGRSITVPSKEKTPLQKMFDKLERIFSFLMIFGVPLIAGMHTGHSSGIVAGILAGLGTFLGIFVAAANIFGLDSVKHNDTPFRNCCRNLLVFFFDSKLLQKVHLSIFL